MIGGAVGRMTALPEIDEGGVAPAGSFSGNATSQPLIGKFWLSDDFGFGPPAYRDHC